MERAVRNMLEETLDEELKLLHARVEKKARQNVGAMCASVVQRMNYEVCGQTLIIRLQIEDMKKS